MRRAGLATVLALLLLGGLASPARADWSPRLAFVEWVNDARQAHGLRPVQISWTLHERAQAHARDMSEAFRIFHCPWFAGGEDVGAIDRDLPVRDLFRAFMRSSEHRAVILSPWRDRIGVGLKGSDGTRFVALFFT